MYGFAVKNTLLCMLKPLSNGSEGLLTIGLYTSSDSVNLVCVYVPINTILYKKTEKEKIYNVTKAIINQIPNHEQLILCGDFNARVGVDCDLWLSCLGHHEIGKMNETEQHLLELCSIHNLFITFFQVGLQHKVWWEHPRSKHWHELDLSIRRRQNLKNVWLPGSYHGWDCDIDHFLMCCKIKLKPERIYQSRQEGKICTDTSKMRHSKELQLSVDTLETHSEDSLQMHNRCRNT